MANVIDILINAVWQGSPSVKRASQDLRGMSDNAASTSDEMASVATSSGLLNQEMMRLGEQVALGNITVGEANKQYEQFAGNMATVEDQAPRTSANLSAVASKLFIVTAALTAAGVATGKLYAGLKEGAELELTQQRFDRLAKTIGTTGEALEGDLRIATAGMISDMEAAALATDLMSLGLAQSHDEVIRLASAASQLGFDMNQLVLTLTNNTTMRFDALGLSVDGFAAKVEKLEAAGVDADKAFDLAFIEQAEAQIERVGNRIDTTAGKLDILESAWTNAINAIKVQSAEDLGGVIDFFAGTTIAATEAEAAALKVADAVGDIGAQKAAVDELKKAIEDIPPISRIAPGIQGERISAAILDIAAAVASSEDGIDAQIEALQRLGFWVGETEIALDGFTFSIDEFNEALDRTRLSRLAEEAQSADRAMGLILDTTVDTGEAAADLAEELDDLQKKVDALDFSDQLERVGLTADEYDRLALAMGGYANAIEVINDLDLLSGLQQNLATLEDLEATLAAQTEAQTDRAELFQEFQDDLTTISGREGERREELEGDFEKRRTDILAKYGATRTQQEEDFLRRRARADARLQSDIDSTREDSADKQIEIRERTNERLAGLERDHLSRVEDIIRNADAQLQEAAGRLDAAAVTSIQQQKKRALDQEAKDYQENRDELGRQLEQQLAAERAASAERIAELRQYNDDRKKIEDEDRAIRLQRQKDAHADRMALLDTQETERLNELRDNAVKERTTANDNYADLWDDRKDIDEEKQAELLRAESAWWDLRLGLIPAGGPNATNLPTETGGFPFAVGPNAGQLPQSLLEQSSVNTGDITFNISGAAGPEATGESVRDTLLQLFGAQ